MSPKHLIVVAGLVGLTFASVPSPIAAQPTPRGQGLPVSRPPAAHPRIEINPRPLVRRRCGSWYEVQYRPSGTVLFPGRHCWWERG
jgi:hypothetical protein